MLAKIDSACLIGLEAARVQVEVSLSKGMPTFSIVGLPDASVREAKDRVVAAIRNTGFEFPARKVTVNLAPADLRKEGACFDLAIAVGILMAGEAITPQRWPRCLWLGELALDGSLRPVRGALPLARSVSRQAETALVVPWGNLDEVSFISGIQLFPFLDLRGVVQWLHAEGAPQPFEKKSSWENVAPPCLVDLADIKGQALAKRALEIAAAGRHNLLMVGSPGTGKSMLAQAVPGILPAWDLQEALDATQVHSAAGVLQGAGLLPQRPYRSPHHSASTVALIGGGDVPAPGEISLAHRGVLFLDELPEFRRDALEALRQPLEQGVVHIHRAKGRATFPSDFLLIAAMNPCPCGYSGHPKRECSCPELRIQKYIGKISGPLLDRIDLQVELPALRIDELFDEKGGAEPSVAVKARVEKARHVQEARYPVGPGRPRDNAHLSVREVKRYCPLTSDAAAVLKVSVDRLGLSARAFDRIRKVARTIADLSGAEQIDAAHVAEAVQYRSLDRQRGARGG
jgi:magnesium chelatase family protein